VLTLVVARPDVATEQNLSRLGARSCERIPLSLEDAFVEYTVGDSGRGDAPPNPRGAQSPQ
jgi:hypothetical protein